jgi:TatA/E family protein of Tat protein translocase
MFERWYVLVILAVIALIIFGPRRLPELGEGLGKAIKEFRKATSDVTQGIRDEVQRTERATGTTYTGTATPTEPGAEPSAPTTSAASAPPAEAPKA